MAHGEEEAEAAAARSLWDIWMGDPSMYFRGVHIVYSHVRAYIQTITLVYALDCVCVILCEEKRVRLSLNIHHRAHTYGHHIKP